MKNQKLIINFLYIENTFIYKSKDLLKNKDQKMIIDYTTIIDKSLDKNESMTNKNILIGILINKKLKKLISKNKEPLITIYYILSSFDETKIKNLNSLINTYFDGTIINNIYTDFKILNQNIPDNIFKPEQIKK